MYRGRGKGIGKAVWPHLLIKTLKALHCHLRLCFIQWFGEFSILISAVFWKCEFVSVRHLAIRVGTSVGLSLFPLTHTHAHKHKHTLTKYKKLSWNNSWVCLWNMWCYRIKTTRTHKQTNEERKKQTKCFNQETRKNRDNDWKEEERKKSRKDKRTGRKSSEKEWGEEMRRKRGRGDERDTMAKYGCN